MRALVLAAMLGLVEWLTCQETRHAPPTPSFEHLQRPPKGLPKMPPPEGYAATAAMFELGRDLFHDGVLSRDRTISCASCHPPANGFASPAPRPRGVDDQEALMHAPTLLNRGWGRQQRWDGSSPSLEAFVLEPIADPREMGSTVAGALERLNGEASWQLRFQHAFGAPADATSLQRALATFVRGITSGNVAYDAFVAGETDTLTTQQRQGLWVFESKGGCWQCHTPPLFTDERFHNTGVGAVDGIAKPGQATATANHADTGRFKTPTLRGLRWTAPYMHDGSFANLDDVVAFYARGGNANAYLDPHLRPLALTADEQQALVAFLQSL
jgi:cytochrome c peroxidase